MFLNKILSLVLLFIFIYNVNGYEKESESDEDDKLRQALVLVEILKKEYLKLLQSQYVVQQQQQLLPQGQLPVASATTSDVLPTLNDTLHETEPEHHVTRHFRRMGSGKDMPGLPNGRRANKVPIDKVWNKKFLASYRRALSEPANESSPNATNDVVKYASENTTGNKTGSNKENNEVNMAGMKTESATINKTSRSTTKKGNNNATLNKIQNVNKATTKIVQTKKSIKNLTSPVPKNKPILRNGTVVKSEENVTKDPIIDQVASEENVTKDPIIDQVASELHNELKEDGINKEDKQKVTPIFRTRFLDVKPTLRIHLARSTKLPMPLPENNAFCYYVPRTPLCINRA